VQRYKEGDESLLSIMLDFVEATQEMQHKDTPSGTFRDGGLGEVKFEVNREPFTGSWGRPQRDGPALRASLLINFARQYLRVGGSAADFFVAKTLFDLKDDSDTAIKADLNYVASTWSQKGFDLWEEVNGHHFFTLIVSYRAMKDGAAFARERDDPRSAARYDEAASAISARLKDFYDPEKGYIQVTLDTVHNHGKDSGLDTCIVLGVLHAGDEVGEWTVTDDRVLATHFAVVESMRREYPINARYKYKYGTGVGRYVEDVYDGVDMSRAHPWYLCTLAHAELLYRAADAFASKPITISSLTRPFFEALRGPEAPLPDGQISAAEQQSLVAVMRSRADEFVDVVRDWKTPQGNLSEQFSRCVRLAANIFGTEQRGQVRRQPTRREGLDVVLRCFFVDEGRKGRQARSIVTTSLRRPIPLDACRLQSIQ
jgi:glucoamylase